MTKHCPVPDRLVNSDFQTGWEGFPPSYSMGHKGAASELIAPVKAWCEAHFPYEAPKCYWGSDADVYDLQGLAWENPDPKGWSIRFEHENDALFFKMRWLDSSEKLSDLIREDADPVGDYIEKVKRGNS